MKRFQEDIEGACLALALIGCMTVGVAFAWFIGSLCAFALYDSDLSLRLFGRIAALGGAGSVVSAVFVLLPVVVPRILAPIES